MSTSTAQPVTTIRLEPLSLMPAEPGWRAVYFAVDANGEGTDDVTDVLPLVGWGVFHNTERDDRNTVIADHGTGIAGVVADHTYPQRVRYLICAEDRLAADGRFGGYLAPGAPVPGAGALGDPVATRAC